MRRAIALMPVLLAQCVPAATERVPQSIYAQPVVVSAAPVELYPGMPRRHRLGALTYLGGWALRSDTPAFGGLSSLVADGPEFVALGDAGMIVRFRVGRFGHVSRASIAPTPAGCDGGRDKTQRDTEGLGHDPVSGRWWISYEWRNAVCRASPDLGHAERVAAPPEMAKWRRRSGAETVAHLANGDALVIAESAPDGGAQRPALLFPGDPAVARPHVLSYRPPAGFRPTDAAQLPDGRILVLNRRFSFVGLFTAKLVLLDGLPGRGRVIASFEPPALTENFEGIAVTEEGGRPIVWLISDDNYMSWQRTLLLKFRFDG